MQNTYGKILSLPVIVLAIFSLVSSMFVSPSSSYAASTDKGVKVKEAIFMMGSPAAGKSSTRKALYPSYQAIDSDELKKDAWALLQGQYKKEPNSTVNVHGEIHKLSDYAELLTKKYDETNVTMVQVSHVQSKMIARKLFENALNKQNSFAYDTTGVDIERMKKEMLEAKQHGFKVVIVYAVAPLNVCLERNAKRERSAVEDIVKRMWHDVEKAWNQLKDLPVVDETKKIDTTRPIKLAA